MRLSLRLVELASNGLPTIALCEEDGTLLPDQVDATVEFPLHGPPSVTIKFLVGRDIGLDIPREPAKMPPIGKWRIFREEAK